MPVIHRVRVDFNIPGHPTQRGLRVEKIPPTKTVLTSSDIEGCARIAQVAPSAMRSKRHLLLLRSNDDYNSIGICALKLCILYGWLWTTLCLRVYISGAYAGFSEGGGGGREEGRVCRNPPKKLTSQRSVQLG